MINLRTLNGGIILNCLGGCNLITWVLKIREPLLAVVKEDVTMKKDTEKCNVGSFEDGGKGP